MTEPPPSENVTQPEQARRMRACALLMSAAAHDLRTPLNTMAGWLQVLQTAHDLPDATRERAFKGLQSAVAQQTALADGLAQAAAVHGEAAPRETELVDLEDALGAALAAQDGEARAKAVELYLSEVTVPPLHGDPHLIAALLRHCLAGALKFASKNSRLGVVAVAPAQPGGATLVEMVIERSLVPAEGMDAMLRYARGELAAKPNGAGAAFPFGVGQGIAGVIGATLVVETGIVPEEVRMRLAIPGG